MNDATRTTGAATATEAPAFKPGEPQFERYRAYRRERAARLAACPGGDVTKYPGKWIWYCDGCGSEFTDEAEAIAPKHETEEGS